MANDLSGNPAAPPATTTTTTDELQDPVGRAARHLPTPGISYDAPAPQAAQVPHADPVHGTHKPEQPGKYVSGNMHDAEFIPIQGMVDHPARAVDGTFYNAHTPGLTLIPNPRIAAEKRAAREKEEREKAQAQQTQPQEPREMPER